jgi:hypothetical protein
MATGTIHAMLDDGPRAGEVLEVRARPDGGPPPELVIRNPLAPTGQDSPRDQRTELDAVLPHVTTYRLHEQRGPARFAYRTGSSDYSNQV